MYYLIDLSLTIDPNDSEPVTPDIQYVNHTDGAAVLGKDYGISAEDFPENMAVSQEIVSLTNR
jgi:hypothetical protein